MNYIQARDVIYKVFKDAWDLLGTPPGSYPAIYPDLPGEPPTSETVWARVTIRHADGKQASLAGENGARRWNRVGVLFIQVFAPVGDGLTAAYTAAQAVGDAYQAARGLDVWFRNIRVNEVGASGAFEQVNVLVDFSYDDVR